MNNNKKKIDDETVVFMWQEIDRLKKAGRFHDAKALLISAACADGYVPNIFEEIPFWKDGRKWLMLPCGRAGTHDIATRLYAVTVPDDGDWSSAIVEKMDQPNGTVTLPMPNYPNDKQGTWQVWPVSSDKPRVDLITQHFGANLNMHKPYGLIGHNGVDIQATKGQRIVAPAHGTVRRVTHEDGESPLGISVEIVYHTGESDVIAHLSQAVVLPNDVVAPGTLIGEVGMTGVATDFHFHAHRISPDATKGGETFQPHDMIDIMPTVYSLIGAHEGVEYVDLLPYMHGQVGGAYMMRHERDGSVNNERYQIQRYEDDPRGWTWYITKNKQWELWGCTGKYIRLYADTSPGRVAGDGNGDMVYRVTDAAGLPGGRWATRFMAVGSQFIEEQTHRVQFFRKRDGSRWNELPTGFNKNDTTLFDLDNGEIKIGKKVTPQGGETHLFDRVGRLGWDSHWGTSRRSMDDPGDYQNEREGVNWLLGEWFRPF